MHGILVGYDGSEHSLKALEWAAREAAIVGADLTVLSVCPATLPAWGEGPDDDVESDGGIRETCALAEEQAGKVLARTGADLPRPPVTVRVIRGLPAEELLDAAAGADMVVVGSRGAGGFKKLRLGSVSSHLAHHAHCPVVIIPADSDCEEHA